MTDANVSRTTKVQRLTDGTVAIHSRMAPKIRALHGWPGPHFMGCAARIRARGCGEMSFRHRLSVPWWDLYTRQTLERVAAETTCDERQVAGALWYWHRAGEPYLLETTVYGWSLPLFEDLLSTPVILSTRDAVRTQLNEGWEVARQLTHRPHNPLTDPPVDVAWVMHPGTRAAVMGWEHEQQADYLTGLRVGRDPYMIEELQSGPAGPGAIFDMPRFTDPGEYAIRGLPVRFSMGTPLGQIRLVRVLGQPGVEWQPLARPQRQIWEMRAEWEARSRARKGTR